MEQSIQLQFLDLDDVDHEEQEYVKSLLYSSVRSPRLELPWVEPEEVPQDWVPEQYDGEPEIPDLETAMVPPANEVYQVPAHVQTTMPQLYQVMSPIANLPYVPTNMGPPPPPTAMGYYVYPEERTRRSKSKPSPKRSREAYPPTPTTVSYQYPIPMTVSPTPYHYISQPPHMPSAQHAAGPPLYIAPPPHAVQIIPAHMYQGYAPPPHAQPAPVYSPHPIHHDEYKVQPLPPEEKHPPPEPQEPEKPPVEKPPSVPINAIKTVAPPTVPVKKPASTGAPQPVEEKLPENGGGGGKSWAGLFKGAAAPERQPPQPPMTAVATNPPPPDLSKPPQPQPPRAQTPEVDLLVKNLGDNLSSYQLEHKALVLTPRGLTNPSNYCYINASLQALLACPPFYNLIKTIAQVKEATGPLPGAKPTKTNTPIIDSMIQFIKEFSPAPVNRSGRKEKSYWNKEEVDIPVGAPFEPTYVYKMLHALRNETAFQVEGRQEDAEEFLSLLLNGLNDEMLELVKVVEEVGKESPLVNGDIEVTANGESHREDSADWKEVSKGMKGGRITRRAEMGRTPLSEIFRGQLRSRLQKADEESTDNVQPFFTLQLDIESSNSVGEALERYFGSRDPVEGAGSTDGDMWQQHSLEELPNVLILHLKCFLYRQQSCHKIAKPLNFTIDLKIDPKFVSSKYKNSGKMKHYKLFAVVYHDGKEASKGHYLTDAFHVGSGGWVRYDDSVVKSVTEANILKPKPPRMPYLLFYRRFDTIGQQTAASQLPR